MTSLTIALDAMGGDYGPKVIVPAALRALKKHQNLKIILVGDRDTLESQLKKLHSKENTQLSIYHATQIVEMDEPPAQALRFKKDSSMRVAINLVKNKEADGCVSAGNTGALVATARFVLKTLAGIDRPAISALFPTSETNRAVRVLDLGANVNSTAEQLVQFAMMGSILASSVGGIENPTVSLLNIGEEAIKGTDAIKEAAKLLSENKHINYIGFIEGDNLYNCSTDVVVCDGFVGNVALKTSEGLARLMGQIIKDAFNQNLMTKLAGLTAYPVLKTLAAKFEPGRYNGASLVGLRGTVVKSHGGADIFAFANAITEAVLEIQKQIPDKIRSQIESFLTI